ncbi:spindle and kinetochore-associated protein 3 isoform X1 [Tachysurus fulvidraco]|uniref:spindle and kinetochore-associated protein 3 isoform X1 n=2 Tax=Tachysurus fulvidraco TaxID=1234273 RepID=UPI001FEFBCCF|nr:spindle and kinetochore-associated protein 3 isoform X1 [Tachysurus fulvidraco]
MAVLCVHLLYSKLSMDTSTRFFAKLRKLAVNLDTERSNLEHAASQNLDQDDDETESGAVQALHKLHSEVRSFKKQVQSQVASQEDGSTELRSFIKACMVLKQRTTEDIERIQRHCEKYGYKPEKASLKPEVNCKAEADARSVDDKPEGDAFEEIAGDGELVEAPECETPERMPPQAVDPMRTPQLSDFGLSALHLQMLGNPDSSQNVARVPAVALTPPSLLMTTCEVQPKTPKCSLIMDEEALTPRLEDFGITESTMCFNNDFTMDLFRKKPPKDRQNNSTTQQLVLKEPPNLPAAPSCVSLGRLSGDSMESPELPVFSTLEIKMNKQLGQSCSNGGTDLKSPSRPSAATATPELPTFETPYLSKLISARKETKKNEDERLTGSLNSTSYPEEERSQMPVSLSHTEEHTPEMPRLQSFFSSTLPCIGTGNRSAVTDPQVPVLQADEHTQDWCLATPRIRMEFDVEPRTPEMPDMSSITQDIFKLVAQANNKLPTTTSAHTSSKASLNTLAPGKENRTQGIAQISEKELHGLASYMKQIPLTSLNLALNKINQVLEERHTGAETNSEEFHMEELRKILDVGPQAPLYILCLVELKRLENVQGFGRNASFKVLTKT